MKKLRGLSNVALLASALAIWPTLALAHSHLATASPEKDEVVTHAIETVTLTFSEDVEPRFSKIEVTEMASGGRVDQGKATPTPAGKATLTEALKQPLKAGKYNVTWKVTSVDTHKSHGEYIFTYAPKK